jgi:hypothetical protein
MEDFNQLNTIEKLNKILNVVATYHYKKGYITISDIKEILTYTNTNANRFNIVMVISWIVKDGYIDRWKHNGEIMYRITQGGLGHNQYSGYSNQVVITEWDLYRLQLLFYWKKFIGTKNTIFNNINKKWVGIKRIFKNNWNFLTVLGILGFILSIILDWDTLVEKYHKLEIFICSFLN